MHCKPEKEKAIDFIDKLEKKIYNAVVRSNNKIQSVDFVMRSTTDEPLR